jgi:capsular polysaccharide biosynthesis protein
MDLREYIKIIRENFGLFAGTVFLIVLGSFSYFMFRPIFYNISLTLNITRKGAQETTDYKFDNFYRLQADEKFAETIVQWLKSPRTVTEIYSKSGINPEQFTERQLTKYFKAEKLSSQVVSVSFSAGSAEMAKKISNALPEIISKNTDRLNENQKENTWFEIIPQEAVVTQNTFDPVFVFAVFLIIGIFVAFWIVMIFHYLK